MEILQMSLAGSVMIAAVTAARALTAGRLPRTALLPLWGAALLRLLVPVFIPSPLSIYNLLPQKAAAPAAAVPGTAALSPLWLGTGALAVLFLLSYLRVLRTLRGAWPAESAFFTRWLARHPMLRRIRIRVTPSAPPMTAGILRPVILLPEAAVLMDKNGLECILAHELVHIRRFDALWKLLLAAAACIHWFNPLVWLMCVLASRDLELSCDERVLRKLGPEKRGFYARLLISMEEAKRDFSPLCSGFSKNAIEERIVAVMNMKKMTAAGLALAFTLTAGALAVFATSPQAAVPASKVVPITAVEKSAGQSSAKMTSYSIASSRAGSNEVSVSAYGPDGKPLDDGSTYRTITGSDGKPVFVSVKPPLENATIQDNGDGTHTITTKDGKVDFTFSEKIKANP